MSCEQLSSATAADRKEWMDIRCNSLDSRSVKSGALQLPSLSTINGDYILTANSNVLYLTPSPASVDLMYFQGNSIGDILVQPDPILTVLRLEDNNQLGDFVYDFITGQLTVTGGIYQLSLSAVIQNSSGSSSNFYTGFTINGTNGYRREIDLFANGVSTVVNSCITQNLPPGSTITPYALGGSSSGRFYSVSLIVNRLR